MLELQDAATLYILKKDPNINIPQLVGEIYQERKDGQLYLIRLLTYVEGDLMSKKTDKPKGYEQMGCFLGRLSNSLLVLFNFNSFQTILSSTPSISNASIP